MTSGASVQNILLAVLVAAGLSGAIMFFQKRKATEGWSGTVMGIDRCDTEDGDWSRRSYVTVRYMRDDGEPHSFEVDASSYPFHFADLQPGDRLVKPAGALLPHRVPAGSGKG